MFILRRKEEHKRIKTIFLTLKNEHFPLLETTSFAKASVQK